MPEGPGRCPWPCSAPLSCGAWPWGCPTATPGTLQAGSALPGTVLGPLPHSGWWQWGERRKNSSFANRKMKFLVPGWLLAVGSHSSAHSGCRAGQLCPHCRAGEGGLCPGCLARLQILVGMLKQTDCGVSHRVSSVQRRVVKGTNKTGEKAGIDTGLCLCEQRLGHLPCCQTPCQSLELEPRLMEVDLFKLPG